MRRMAFGWMDLDPEVFYLMETEDFILKSEGFRERMKYESHLVMKLAFTTHASMSSKPLNYKAFELYWVGGKKRGIEDRQARDERIMKQIAIMEAIQEAKDKMNGRAAQNSN